jgi:putative transposase
VEQRTRESVTKGPPRKQHRAAAPSLEAVPRPLRLQFPGAIYNVGTRGVRRSKIYWDDRHYEIFERLLTAVVRRYGWLCHTHCLMPNHYHLLIETPQPNLSPGMQLLNGTYGQWFNRKHGLSGHVFERRFYANVVESNYHLLELARYIVLNPVRAGLCKHPGEWKWSSYRALAGDAPAPPFLTIDWLLEQFGRDRQSAERAYAMFVQDAPRRARCA